MKTKSLNGFTIKSADEGTVEAVIATFGVIDKDGDVTYKGAFTDGAAVVMSAYGHQSWAGALPIGKGTIHETDDEALFKGQFFLDTTHGRDAFATVKALSADGLQEWSYSLHDVVAGPATVDGKSARELKSIFVKEVSPVLRGAGVDTRTLAVKGEGLKFSEHAEAVLAGLDAFAARTAEVVALRSEKGKGLSDDVAALIERIVEAAARLKSGPPPAPPQTDSVVLQAFLQHVARTQGVTP